MRELRCTDYSVISDADLDAIHEGTLEILRDVGVKMECRPACEILADCGCHVDFQEQVVRIPETVLSKALSTAPSEFTLFGVIPDFDMPVDTERIYTIGGSSALFTIGLDGERKPATLQDLEDLTRLQDGLSSLDMMHGIVNPQDIPQEAFDRRLFPAVMKNSGRFYYSQAIGSRGVQDQIEMASVIRGSREAVKERPVFSIVLCLVSPLIHPPIRTEELIESAKNGIPLFIEVDAQPGATSPVTLAGTLVEQNANILAGIVLAQTVNPGLPCIYSTASAIMEPSFGSYCAAAPESTLLHAAAAQVSRYYGLPFQGGTGIDAVLSDVQAGYERGMQVLANALAGTNFIHLSIGMMDQLLSASYIQCVIDNEIIGAAFRIAEGVEVNKNTLAVDVIKDVGIGGNYLVEDHTLRYLRKLRWKPELTVRQRWELWEASGRKSMYDRAKEKAEHILAEHHPEYISPEQKRELDCMAVQFQNEAIEESRG